MPESEGKRAPWRSFDLLQRLPLLTMTVAAVCSVYVAIQVGSIAVQTFEDTRVMHEYLEGASLLSVEAWRDGGLKAMYPTDYNDPETGLIITPYPPVFHGLWRGAARLLGDGTYAPGRIVALLALGVVVLLIYRIARHVGLSRLTSAVVSFCLLIPIPVTRWVAVARVDFLGLAFAVFGLWMYLRYRDRSGFVYLLCAIPFILTGLTKQSMIAAPAAVVLTELIEGRWKRSLLLAVSILGTILVVMLTLNMVTDGGFFDATVRSLADEIFFVLGVTLAGDLFVSGPVPFVLALLALSLWVRRDFRHRVLLLYAGISVAVLALTIGKPGSNVNYYIEPVAALCLAGAAGLAGFNTKAKWREWVTAGFAVCVVWGAVLVVQPLRVFQRYKDLMLTESRRIELPEDPLHRPVLAPTSTLLLLEPRREFYVNDDFTFSAFAAWDKLLLPGRVIDDLRTHRIGAVIVDRNVLAPEVPQPSFVGDWQGGWNFWSVDGFREALFAAYAPSDIELPLQLVLFLPNADAGNDLGQIPNPAR